MWIGDTYIDTEDIRDALIIVLLLVSGGRLVGEIIYDNNHDKQMAELAETIAKDLNYSSVEVKNFDWFVTDDSEYLFKFTGSATNSMNQQIDFFSCSYEVSEYQYKDILDYISSMKIENVRELTQLALLKKVNAIVKEAELVSNKENLSVVSEESQDSVILNVSKAKVNGDKVSYYVSYATPVKDASGELILRKTLAEVNYDLTEELNRNPNGVFMLNKDEAKVKVMDVKEQKLDIFQLQMFNNETPGRRKI